MLARLRGLRFDRYIEGPYRIEPAEVGLARAGIGLVAFSSPYCRSCQRWSAALAEAGLPVTKIDVADRPDLARRYRVSRTPLVVAASLPKGRVVEAYTGDPEPARIERLAELAAAG